MKYMTAMMIKRLCRKECFRNKGATVARTMRSVVRDDATLDAIATEVNEKAQACSCSAVENSDMARNFGLKKQDWLERATPAEDCPQTDLQVVGQYIACNKGDNLQTIGRWSGGAACTSPYC
jgi:hypothetical protein